MKVIGDEESITIGQIISDDDNAAVTDNDSLTLARGNLSTIMTHCTTQSTTRWISHFGSRA